MKKEIILICIENFMPLDKALLFLMGIEEKEGFEIIMTSDFSLIPTCSLAIVINNGDLFVELVRRNRKPFLRVDDNGIIQDPFWNVLKEESRCIHGINAALSMLIQDREKFFPVEIKTFFSPYQKKLKEKCPNCGSDMYGYEIYR